ncbi:MAG TPA: PSD1 and planctomycete cytochrome C domain-containing protein, partial [Gemmataceae bacterium]|nr:PSD1 and planctomycete cytochrome C domain-containing protein [Gemmataceae bacterium]
PVDYGRDIKPILHARCFACHGALRQKAGLRLDAVQLIRQGGKSGPAIVPGKSADSLLIEKVTGNDRSRMPPKSEGSPLSGKQIALLKTWIDRGAKAADEPIPEDPRKHWAYQVPVRPAVPVVKNAGWVRNPIDAFVAAEHEHRGLRPQPPADKEVLLRRVYLDLIGLPPTRDELHAFLADQSLEAYERLVDKLLASPRYGERWGRHWMDVWRYSDWYGSRSLNELRNSRRHIWRWRDWIIESLNQDKGYDRMIVEMLAGDELAPGDADAQRATGYLGRSFYVFNRTVWLQDTVEYVGTSLLGMTMKCCRCHDHKYDPVMQEDYYRLRAFFEPHNVRVDTLPHRRDLLKTHVAMGSPPGSELKDGLDCVYDANPTAPTYVFDRGDEKHPVNDRPLAPAVPRILEKEPLEIRPVALPVEAFYPDLRPFRQKEMIAEAQAETDKVRAALAVTKEPAARALAEKSLATAQANLAALAARIAAEQAKYATPLDPRASELALAAGTAEAEAGLRKAIEDQLRLEQQLANGAQPAAPRSGKSPPTKAALEQQLAAAKERVGVARAALAKPTPTYKPLGIVYPLTSTGRRLALARWITSKDNPLTARVAVNHVWLRHFGSALVPTMNNLGLNGTRPTHPALLDWLACELMSPTNNRGEPGASAPEVSLAWSMKHLHRLIVTSNAYRMQSSAAGSDGPNAGIDPENQYLWRMNPRRMEAELVRDSLLHLSGRIDLTM